MANSASRGWFLKTSIWFTLMFMASASLPAVKVEHAAAAAAEEEVPKPKAWPLQFHSILVMNYSGEVQIIDLWYDWPNGRNLNLIQKQLGEALHDVEWNNGTSFFYTLDDDKENPGTCRSAQLEVGILRPNWLDGATYLGRRSVDGFLCNVWEKADFITYYEDVVTQRPVHWVFYTGRNAHVMTFEVGAVLEDSKWQAPSHCFSGDNNLHTSNMDSPAFPSSLSRVFHARGMGDLRAAL